MKNKIIILLLLFVIFFAGTTGLSSSSFKLATNQVFSHFNIITPVAGELEIDMETSLYVYSRNGNSYQYTGLGNRKFFQIPEVLWSRSDDNLCIGTQYNPNGEVDKNELFIVYRNEMKLIPNNGRVDMTFTENGILTSLKVKQDIDLFGNQKVIIKSGTRITLKNM